jgi:hypothetical protein
MRNLLISLAVAGMVMSAQAAITHTTTHDANAFAFESQLSNDDLIAGQIGVDGPDLGWHPAIAGDPTKQLPVFTDGTTGGGLNGLLNDFPNLPFTSDPTKVVRYDIGGQDITGINILAGNEGADGRVFMTVAIYTDGNLLKYVESDPLGTVNQGTWRSTFVEIFDDSSSILASGVNELRFDFYLVDNTGGQYRDPFDGVNPFTGLDDNLSPQAQQAPLIWEIDVLPEPASLMLLSLAALVIRRR